MNDIGQMICGCCNKFGRNDQTISKGGRYKTYYHQKVGKQQRRDMYCSYATGGGELIHCADDGYNHLKGCKEGVRDRDWEFVEIRISDGKPLRRISYKFGDQDYVEQTFKD